MRVYYYECEFGKVKKEKGSETLDNLYIRIGKKIKLDFTGAK